MRLEGELIDDGGKRVKVVGVVTGMSRGEHEVATEMRPGTAAWKGWKEYEADKVFQMTVGECEIVGEG